jgi:hypothetical protein
MEMQIKTTMKYHLMPIQVTIAKKQETMIYPLQKALLVPISSQHSHFSLSS